MLNLFLPIVSSVVSGVVKEAVALIPDGSVRKAVEKQISPEWQEKVVQKQLDEVSKSNEHQHELNLINAKSGDRFIAGWRPFGGWALMGIVILSCAGFPLLNALLVNLGLTAVDYLVDSVEELLTVLTVWGTLAGIRTIDKRGGVATTAFAGAGKALKSLFSSKN